jgi:hypothetical protein
MKSPWIPFLAITAAVINAAAIAYLNDPRVDLLNGIAAAVCLAIAFLSSELGTRG